MPRKLAKGWTLSDCPTGIPRNKLRYDLDGVQRMLSLLAEHSDRFSTLRLTGSAWPRLMPFSRFRGRLSRLEILELSRQYSGLLETGQFQIAPQLHTIRTPGSHLTGTAVDPERPWLDIPRPQIRSLVISRPYDMAGAGGDRILQLEAFPNLSSLTLDFEAYGSDAIQTMSGNPSVRFTLHRLSYWKIQVASKLEVPQLGWMMDHFKTPALGTLHITYFTEPSNLCDLLRRSQCSLKRLVLQRCAIRVGDLLSVLELAPSLDSLVIDNGSIPTMVTDKFFQGLTLDSGGRTIAPVLRELRIRGQYFFNGGKVLEMLESRVGHDLAVVQLVLSQDALKDSDAERLRAYAGIRVSLDCVPARPYADL
ncbi:hypothetical protein FB45DRAFT_1065375 [Roridomyces roridus]|uniref:Uncharacterized protein n=1 Tax=Roridomyces roridus TaxID=1738132 RepID=A0AAD7FCS7_9AGAR|nr:hypothetical protein FB45DRAFT_1065375 [Roridomyces roridus]